MMSRLVLAACISAVLVGCGRSTIRVTQQEFGERWPFTVPEGRLRCDKDGAREYVTLDTGKGIYYALNGSARSFGFPDSKTIQKPGTTGADLQPFIDRGLRLCR
jgi:hypothetical protein